MQCLMDAMNASEKSSSYLSKCPISANLCSFYVHGARRAVFWFIVDGLEYARQLRKLSAGFLFDLLAALD